MLQSIRDHTQGWIAGSIVSLLILSFALWGIHSYIGGGSSDLVIATVNGTEITKDQLSSAYERLRHQFQAQSPNLPSKATADLKAQALQALVNVEILKQASLAQNYRISSRQIDNVLLNMPQFQVNGQFSQERLYQLLQTTLFTPNEFLQLIQTGLLIDQPRLGLIFTSFALPDEVTNAIQLVNQERDVQYAVLPFQAVAKQNIPISKDNVQAYYNQHQDEFRTTEQVSIEYITFSMSDLAKGSDKQHAEANFASQREKLASITYEHPESLEPAAKALNLKIQTSGMFTKDQGGKDLTGNAKVREVAFSNDILNVQNNSDVIEIGDNAVLVLRVKSHTPASQMALSAVQNKIIDILKTKEQEILVEKRAREIVQQLQQGIAISQINQNYHLMWKPTGYVSRHSGKMDSALLDAIFSMPKPQANKPTFAASKISNGYAIIQLNTVKEGTLKNNNHEQYQAFAQQIQNTQGLMEYELYKQSLIQQAKVELES